MHLLITYFMNTRKYPVNANKSSLTYLFIEIYKLEYYIRITSSTFLIHPPEVVFVSIPESFSILCFLLCTTTNPINTTQLPNETKITFPSNIHNMQLLYFVLFRRSYVIILYRSDIYVRRYMHHYIRSSYFQNNNKTSAAGLTERQEPKSTKTSDLQDLHLPIRTLRSQSHTKGEYCQYFRQSTTEIQFHL